MIGINERPPGGKDNQIPADDDGDRDWVAYSVARRFGLNISLARRVRELGGLGATEERAASSGGRAK